MHNRLTLLIPNLLHAPVPLQNLPPGEIPDFKQLNRFFSRARQAAFPVQGYYETLFHLFGVEPADHAVAAITRLADGAVRDADWYLRCDPAYIHADIDRAVLLGHGALGLSDDDAEQLRLVLNAHLEQDGWSIEVYAVDRWYVKGAGKTNMSTTPPHRVFGRDIRHELPRGEHGGYWCSIMNECQMLLHDQPVNQARQAKGLMPVNSLWFWGEGRLPTEARCDYAAVFGDEPLLRGLANLSDCPVSDGDAIMQALEQQTRQDLLWVIDDLHSPLIADDIFAWLDVVRLFEDKILHRLIDSLKARQLDELQVLTGDGRAFVLTRGLWRRWWRRGAGFTALLHKGAG